MRMPFARIDVDEILKAVTEAVNYLRNRSLQ